MSNPPKGDAPAASGPEKSAPIENDLMNNFVNSSTMLDFSLPTSIANNSQSTNNTFSSVHPFANIGAIGAKRANIETPEMNTNTFKHQKAETNNNNYVEAASVDYQPFQDYSSVGYQPAYQYAHNQNATAGDKISSNYSSVGNQFSQEYSTGCQPLQTPHYGYQHDSNKSTSVGDKINSNYSSVGHQSSQDNSSMGCEPAQASTQHAYQNVHKQNATAGNKISSNYSSVGHQSSQDNYSVGCHSAQTPHYNYQHDSNQNATAGAQTVQNYCSGSYKLSENQITTVAPQAALNYFPGTYKPADNQNATISSQAVQNHSAGIYKPAENQNAAVGFQAVQNHSAGTYKLAENQTASAGYPAAPNNSLVNNQFAPFDSAAGVHCQPAQASTGNVCLQSQGHTAENYQSAKKYSQAAYQTSHTLQPHTYVSNQHDNQHRVAPGSFPSAQVGSQFTHHRAPSLPSYSNHPAQALAAAAAAAVGQAANDRAHYNFHPSHHHHHHLRSSTQSSTIPFNVFSDQDARPAQPTPPEWTYYCDVCGVLLSDYQNWSDHKLKEESCRLVNTCPFCKQLCFTKPDLARHLVERCPVKTKPAGQQLSNDKDSQWRNTCEICNMILFSADELIEHKMVVHRVRALCLHAQCNFNAIEMSSYANHMFKHQAIQSMEYYKQQNNITDDKFFICYRCKATPTTKHDLVKHLADHFKEKAFHCVACPKYYANEAGRRKHMAEKHDLWVHCPLCGIKFDNMMLYKIHLEEHMIVKKSIAYRHSMNPSIPGKFLYCWLCHQEFRNCEQLRAHLLVIHSAGYIAFIESVKLHQSNAEFCTVGPGALRLCSQTPTQEP